MAKDRTFTFRGPSDLVERLEIASELLRRPDDEDVDITELIALEFERRLGMLRDSGLTVDSQSELIRVCIELVAGAAAQIADTLHQAELYAEEPPREWEDPEWLEAVLASRRRPAA